MTNLLNTLIIEDHPIIAESYARILTDITAEHRKIQFNITTAHNCEDANKVIDYMESNSNLDLALLDIRLPPSRDKKIISGDDLGLRLRAVFPNIKLIIITHLNNNYRLLNILKTIKPDGLIIKSELTSKCFQESVLNIINNVPFYSKPILKLLRLHISNDFNLDDIDRKMLYHLSQGVKTKELTTIVHLSQSGIESRKRRLNQLFNNEGKSDKTLLKIAKSKGFL